MGETPPEVMDLNNSTTPEIIKFIENSEGQLTVKQANFERIIQPYLTDSNCLIGFVGILRGDQNRSEKSFTAKLVEKLISSAEASALYDSHIAVSTSGPNLENGMYLWERPWIEKCSESEQLIIIWFMDISTCPAQVELGKTICSQMVKIVLDRETNIHSPETSESQCGSGNGIYILRRDEETPGLRPSVNFHSDISNLCQSLQMKAEFIELENENDDTEMASLVAEFKKTILDVLKNDETFNQILRIPKGLKQQFRRCCTHVNNTCGEEQNMDEDDGLKGNTEIVELQRDDEDLPEEPLGKKLEEEAAIFQGNGDDSDSEMEETEELDVKSEVPENSEVDNKPELEDEEALNESSDEAELQKKNNVVKERAVRKKSPEITHASPVIPPIMNELEKAGEKEVVKFYNNIMAARLNEKKEGFSAKQMKLIHSLLRANIQLAVDSVIEFQQHLNSLTKSLDEQFAVHKQTNLIILKGKTKQLESIIQTLKTDYDKILKDCHSRGEPVQENPEETLKRKLKKELWTKLGPTEPFNAHWNCLKSQVSPLTGLTLLPEGFLGFQLTCGNILMGTWSQGNYVQLKNERDEEVTRGVVGLTKVRTLVYGSQVAHAQKKDVLLKKFHVGKHFEPKDPNFNPQQKYDLPLKTKTSQVGIEFVLGYLLKKLKVGAERQLNMNMTASVITVPFYFASFQRLQVKYAALAAGFKDVTVMSDFSAIAFKFVFHTSFPKTSENFWVLSENNGNLYAGIYTFNKSQQQIRMREHAKHFSVRDHKVHSNDDLKDEDNARNLLTKLKNHFHQQNISRVANDERVIYVSEMLSNHIVVYSETEKWRKTLISTCDKFFPDQTTKISHVSPLDGAVSTYRDSDLKNQLKQMPPHIPHRVRCTSENSICEVDEDRMHFSVSFTTKKTHFFQKLFDNVRYPIGTLWLKRFNPKMKYIAYFAGEDNGQLVLQKISRILIHLAPATPTPNPKEGEEPKTQTGEMNTAEAPRTPTCNHKKGETPTSQTKTAEPPKLPTRDLKQGDHYFWETPENTMKTEMIGIELLIDHFFAKSMEEKIRKEGVKEKLKVDERKSAKEESSRWRRDVIGRCEEMRRMMETDQVKFPQMIKSNLEQVIGSTEEFAKNIKTSLEAVKNEAASLNTYYEAYFSNK